MNGKQNFNSIIPWEKSEAREELDKVLKDKYEEAIKMLVTGVTPDEFVSERPGRGGKPVKFVPGWMFKEQANAVFGHAWSFDIVEYEIRQQQVWVWGKLTITVPSMKYKETHPDGTVVEWEREGFEIRKSQFGGCDIKFKKGMPRKEETMIDIGDDLKGAATDSLKKCLNDTGFFADVYRSGGDTEGDDAGKPTGAQLTALYKKGAELGKSKDEIDTWVKDTAGKPVDLMDDMEILAMLRKLREVKVGTA